MSDGSDLTNRVFFAGFQDPKYHYNEAVLPKVTSRTGNQVNQELKENWTIKFLSEGGFAYILERFGCLELSDDEFKLHELKFTLSVLKKYIISGI